MRLVVGCPVMARGWILPRWIMHVRAACACAELKPTFVFVASKNDPETLRVLDEEIDYNEIVVETTDEPFVDERGWTRVERLEHMADIRNLLLEVVADAEPDLFWSLDSDVLAHPRVLLAARQSFNGYDALGTCCYMERAGTSSPSFAMNPSGGLFRYKAHGTFTVDVIMASKILTPRALEVPYEYHRLGEDVGWSINARSRGLHLGWMGEPASKHVIHPDDLDRVDLRIEEASIGMEWHGREEGLPPLR